MYLATSLMLMLTISSFKIKSQPVKDITGQGRFYELLNPRWRQHRGRFRPFSSVWGSPMANIRGARSTREVNSSDAQPLTECFQNFERLHCFGMWNGEPTTIECDTQEDFSRTELFNVKNLSMSEIRLFRNPLNETGEPIAKMYLYGQMNESIWYNYRLANNETKEVNIFSLHSTDTRTDKGLTVLDKKCWNDLVNFFISIRIMDEILVQKMPTLNLPVRSLAIIHLL